MNGQGLKGTSSHRFMPSLSGASSAQAATFALFIPASVDVQRSPLLLQDIQLWVT